jgi:hypothetical protein
MTPYICGTTIVTARYRGFRTSVEEFEISLLYLQRANFIWLQMVASLPMGSTATPGVALS